MTSSPWPSKSRTIASLLSTSVLLLLFHDIAVIVFIPTRSMRNAWTDYCQYMSKKYGFILFSIYLERDRPDVCCVLRFATWLRTTLLLRCLAFRSRRIRIFFSIVLLPPRRTPSRSLTVTVFLKFDRLRRRIRRWRFCIDDALRWAWVWRVCEFKRWRDTDRPRTLACEFAPCNTFWMRFERAWLRLIDRARDTDRTRTPKRSIILTWDVEWGRCIVPRVASFNKSAFSL